MPMQGTILGDVLEQGGEHLKKGLKEIASAPVDIVKASFEQPIPKPSTEREAQLKAEDQARLAKTRSGLAMEQELRTVPSEQPKVEQGVQMAEQGKTNQNAAMNNLQGQPLSSSMTPKKKMEPLVVQQKRNNKLHGAG